MHSFFHYLQLLGKKWFFWISVSLDGLGIVLFYIEPEWKIPSLLLWFIPILGFFWANYQVYSDANNELHNSPFSTYENSYNYAKELMPQLINEMRKDLSDPSSSFKREFYVYLKNHSINTKGLVLVYYLDDHDDLLEKMNILENLGLVHSVSTDKTVHKYRMTEEFAYLLQH